MRRFIPALFTLCSAGVLHASPPIPDDLSLSVHVVSSTDPNLQPGAHAVLAFEVGQHGPTARDGQRFVIFNASTIADDSSQPIRLAEAPGSVCSFGSFDDQGTWSYSLVQSLPPIGDAIECLVALDVLQGAEGGYLATFSVQVLDPEDGYDPEPGNDTVTIGIAGVFGAFEPPVFYMPYVEPSNPTTAGDVHWLAQWDGCGALGPTTVTRWNDGLIEVRWPISRVCGVPPGGGGGLIDLGSLLPGQYTVHVDPCDVGFDSFDGACWPIQSPEDVSFTVVSAGESRVPTLDGWAARALAVMLVVASLISVGMRSRERRCGDIDRDRRLPRHRASRGGSASES